MGGFSKGDYVPPCDYGQPSALTLKGFLRLKYLSYEKKLFSSIILTALCLAILFVGVSSSANLCTKDRSFVCSVFNFVFYLNTDLSVIAPDESYTKFHTYSDLIYCQDLASSIFHPPKIAS